MTMPNDMFTRDLDTLDEDGPDLTQFEADSAREPSMESRPDFSAVAQPAMDSAIWWHTVEDNRAARAEAAQPTTGMIDRLNGPQAAPPGPGGGRPTRPRRPRRRPHRRRKGHRGRTG